MQLIMLAMSGAPVVNLGADKNVTAVGGNQATATFNGSSGAWTGTAGPGGSGGFSSEWIVPTFYADQGYENRVTLLAGSFSPGSHGAPGTWQPVGSTLTWFRHTNGFVNFTLEVRRASDGVVLDSCTVTLTSNP